MWWQIPAGVAGGLLLLWLVLLAVLWRTKPDTARLRDGLRLLPDLIRLLRRLAADPQQPRGVRIWLVLLLAYLLSPIDLVPDFIPILGYADDAIIIAIALCSITHRAGTQVLARHWPGTSDGLATIGAWPGYPKTMINRSDGVPANDTPTPAELPTTALMVFRLPPVPAADQHLSSLTAHFRRIRFPPQPQGDAQPPAIGLRGHPVTVPPITGARTTVPVSVARAHPTAPVSTTITKYAQVCICYWEPIVS